MGFGIRVKYFKIGEGFKLLHFNSEEQKIFNKTLRTILQFFQRTKKISRTSFAIFPKNKKVSKDFTCNQFIIKLPKYPLCFFYICQPPPSIQLPSFVSKTFTFLERERECVRAWPFVTYRERKFWVLVFREREIQRNVGSFYQFNSVAAG